MEKAQYDLCIQVVERLHRAGILRELIVVGSWCLPFYEAYFADVEYHPSIRTRDIDFLIPQPRKLRSRVDVPGILKDLGFIKDISGDVGYIRLLSLDLIVEFLVPERGRGFDKPFPLPGLGMNAQSLRFLDFLAIDPITAQIQGHTIILPHPARFALHKLIVAARRSKPEKAAKDRNEGVQVMDALRKKRQFSKVERIYQVMPPKWRQVISRELRAGQAENLAVELEKGS